MRKRPGQVIYSGECVWTIGTASGNQNEFFSQLSTKNKCVFLNKSQQRQFDI